MEGDSNDHELLDKSIGYTMPVNVQVLQVITFASKPQCNATGDTSYRRTQTFE